MTFRCSTLSPRGASSKPGAKRACLTSSPETVEASCAFPGGSAPTASLPAGEGHAPCSSSTFFLP